MTDRSDTPDTPQDALEPEEIDEPSEEDAAALLASLKLEHRRIDQEIDALIETGVADMLKVRRMKKIKLSIKDQISYLENELTPDIIA
jgi:hypothetical protein